MPTPTHQDPLLQNDPADLESKISSLIEALQARGMPRRASEWAPRLAPHSVPRQRDPAAVEWAPADPGKPAAVGAPTNGAAGPPSAQSVVREPLFRFRLIPLFVLMAATALFCTAFASGGAAWAAASGTVVAFALAAAVLLAVLNRGADRAFWVGFATFAVVCLKTGSSWSPVGFTLLSHLPEELARWQHSNGSLYPEMVARHGLALLVATVAAYVCRAVYVAHQRRSAADAGGA